MACGVMNQNDIEKWRGIIEDMRGRLANVSRREIVSLAEMLGRILKSGGKHPAYVSPLSRPNVSIPNNLKKWTAKGIIDVLERDVDAWEEALRRKSGGKRDGE